MICAKNIIIIKDYRKDQEVFSNLAGVIAERAIQIATLVRLTFLYYLLVLFPAFVGHKI